ncbi:hypothetical protein [Paracidovorax cattleyae]|uniref:Uncharacterized protein n=1 Tax=Paracidovorax cattleyae TaxID=80868 RepID=A0A1H0WWZ6_9BURK|nr:hypothetical protein [Paracidovorax cattleyae]SDP95231.1 hypothetical protein SAMN04489708_1783 [Paracidovorax cattleyae]
MRDYWLTQSLLQAVGWGYVLAVVIALLLAGWAPRRNKVKVLAVLVVLVVASILPIKGYRQYRDQQQIAQERKERYQKAKALFDERCKGGGEKIYETVENVNGFLWQRWRPSEINYGDQFALTDPYGRNCGGEECIKPMLRVISGEELNLEDASRHADGYRFVETINPVSGEKYKYTAVVKSIHKRTPEQMEDYRKNIGKEPVSDVYGFSLEKELVKSFSARYGVTWDDISTPEDRAYWIAGGAIRITDLQTRKVIAERIGYLMDPGQGNTAGDRGPWPWARSSEYVCPSVDKHNINFIRSVLKPSKGE